MFADSGIQERLKGYNHQPNFYPTAAWLTNVVPTPESILKTVALMRANGLTASIVLPSRDEALNIGKTLERMKFFSGFELGSLAVYDNSSHDNTRAIVQTMNVTLVKAEQRAKQYKVPTEALHKGTNIWFGIIDALRKVEDPTKHIVVFSDTDVGLSTLEIMQLLRPFAENPQLKLVLPFVSRLTQRGQKDGKLTSGGRASNFTWGPIRDALLFPYLPDIMDHPAQLAGIYGVNLDFVSNIDIPHGFGLETAIQAEAYISAYRNARTAHEAIQFVPCGVYSQTGQSDHAIRAMSHDIAHELKYRIDKLRMQQLQSIGSQSLGLEFLSTISALPQIQRKRRLRTEHTWTVVDEQLERLESETIGKDIYYLPPAKPFLKSWSKSNAARKKRGRDNQAIELDKEEHYKIAIHQL